jgi:hypothetical protein
MLLTVEGVYRNGKIELAEIPESVEQADVLVVFLNPKPANAKPRMITFGQFAGERKTNEEDFSLAEWRGEPEFEDLK